MAQRCEQGVRAGSTLEVGARTSCCGAQPTVGRGEGRKQRRWTKLVVATGRTLRSPCCSDAPSRATNFFAWTARTSGRRGRQQASFVCEMARPEVQGAALTDRLEGLGRRRPGALRLLEAQVWKRGSAVGEHTRGCVCVCVWRPRIFKRHGRTVERRADRDDDVARERVLARLRGERVALGERGSLGLHLGDGGAEVGGGGVERGGANGHGGCHGGCNQRVKKSYYSWASSRGRRRRRREREGDRRRRWRQQ